METARHWNEVWSSKAFEETSWFQTDPTPSWSRIERVLADGGSPAVTIDAGCGLSRLADGLLERGHRVLGIDIAAEAIDRLRSRLSRRDDGGTHRFTGLVGDLGRVDPLEPLDREGEAMTQATLWHDRAVLHFLHGDQRTRYADTVRRRVGPGGHVIVAGFAPDGPTKCSGIDVVRASDQDIAALFGDRFEIADSSREIHQTPWASEQAFQWTVLRDRR